MMRPVLFATLLAAAGCAQHVEPLLTLGGRACDAQPVMEGAIPVPFDRVAGANAPLGMDSRCLLQPGGPATTYAVFKLPDAPAPYTVTIASVVSGDVLVAPRATVRDGAGSVLRTVEPAAFRTNLNGYQTGLRSQPGEQFLVVAADTSDLGHRLTLRLSARETGTQVAAVIFIPVGLIAQTVPQQQTQQGITLSLNGTVHVSTAPVATVR